MDNQNYFGDDKRKFIGGAEQARQKAQKRVRKLGETRQESDKRKKKRKGQKINVPGEGHRFKFGVRKGMSPFEIFFDALLKCDAGDILRCRKFGDSELSYKMSSDVIERGNCPKVICKLPGSYSNARHYYSVRASLVLEEARCVLSNSLFDAHRRRSRMQQQSQHRHYNSSHTKRPQNNERHNDGLIMTLINAQPRRKSGHALLTFEKKVEGFFTPQESSNMRPGCVFELVPMNTRPSAYRYCSEKKSAIDTTEKQVLSVLGFVMPLRDFGKCESREDSSSSNLPKLKLVICDPSGLPPRMLQNGTCWSFIPITNMISYTRQFDVCTICPSVQFLPKIMGWPDSTHTRFTEEDCSANSKTSSIVNERNNNMPSVRSNNGIISSALPFQLPLLNSTQQRASDAFLSSPPSTLTLIQGPPGTGKTTFLVSVLCRSLMKDPLSPSNPQINVEKRIFVTAPTNRAISVLATRFLNAIGANTAHLNIVLIGVEDKLDLPQQESHQSEIDHSSQTSRGQCLLSPPSLSLRDIFVYDWIASITHAYNELDRMLFVGNDMCERICYVSEQASVLKKRLQNGLPHLSYHCGTSSLCKDLESLLTEASDLLSAPEKSDGNVVQQVRGIIDKAKDVVKSLNDSLHSMNPEKVTGELLETANVIFCTLISAGVSSMKRMKSIDDLFVDEAAAATEPELCVPFQLFPRRMLAVGDPKQLPATVVSKMGAGFGLDKSLHERLMYECDKDHIMLDIQYRMRPEISMFPSKTFYDGKILNGANVRDNNYKGPIQIFHGEPCSFLDVTGREQQSFTNSYYNEDEAKLVVDIVKQIKLAANNSSSFGQQQQQQQQRQQRWDSHSSVRIITFYQGQVSCIQRCLQRENLGQVLVATVDSSQGCEADIVIVSFVRSSHHGPSSVGFLTDERRMNVALTRAKYQIVCVGNSDTLSRSGSSVLESIVDDAKERNILFTYNNGALECRDRKSVV